MVFNNFLDSYFNEPLMMLSIAEENIGQYHEDRVLYNNIRKISKLEEDRVKQQAWADYKKLFE